MMNYLAFTKNETTGVFSPIEMMNQYLAYDGGEVWFSYHDIRCGQVEGTDYYAYQWTRSYTNVVDDESVNAESGATTHLSRKYDTLEEAREACWATLEDKERYADMLGYVTDGEQTLDDLCLLFDQ